MGGRVDCYGCLTECIMPLRMVGPVHHIPLTHRSLYQYSFSVPSSACSMDTLVGDWLGTNVRSGCERE